MSAGPISFSGMNSGLDAQSIVTQLMKLERRPLDALVQRKAMAQARITSLGEFDSAASKLRSAADKLTSSSVAQGKKATVGDETVFKATALSTARPGSYSLRVDHLATTAKMASGAVADKDVTLVGAGTFTIKTGDASTGVTTTDIEFEGGTLQDLRAAIGSSSAGVSASILHDSTGDRLVLTAKDSGLKGKIEIVDGLSGGDTELTFATTVPAVDALVEVDGVLVTSSTNKLSGVIEGVTIDLVKAKPDETIELTVENDEEGLKAALDAFVEGYNGLKKFIDTQGKRGGKLDGDPLLSSTERRLRSIIAGMEAQGLGKFETLGQIGIKTERDGTLSLDSGVFNDALEDSYEDVASLLRLTGKASNPSVGVVLVGSAKAGSYAVEITQAATRGELIAGQSIDAQNGLSAAETLSFTFGTASATIELAQGDTVTDVIAKVNTGLKAAGIKVAAYDSGGSLRLRSDLHGSAQSFTVTSSQADQAGSTGIGQGLQSVSGLDVAGTIGGHPAVGKGQMLSGIDGTDVEGLGLRIAVSGAGSAGTVSIGGGVMNSISEQILQTTRTGSGMVDQRENTLRASIRSMDLRIDQMSSRFERREEVLLRQFLKADEALGQLNGQLGNLGSQIRSF